MYATKIDLWGNETVTDYRPTAGGSASESGKQFEDVVACKLYESGVMFDKRPSFPCFYGLRRKGDFLININGNVIHIECKQLGNAESHFDKLSHCFMNLIQGCYGENFWLVYDYNREGKPNTLRKIKHLKDTAEKIEKQARLSGILFKLIDINDLQNTIYKYQKLS